MSDWIKIHRSIKDSYVFGNPVMFKVWIWLLLKAQFSNKIVQLKTGKGVQDIALNRGEVLFGRKKAAETLNLSESMIFRCVKKLEKQKNITTKSNNHFTIITICNYDSYQNKSWQNEQPMIQPIVQPMIQPMNTEKKVKNEKNLNTVRIENEKNKKNETSNGNLSAGESLFVGKYGDRLPEYVSRKKNDSGSKENG